ncbi:hypothetical protein CW354_04495 [Marinicaulis flavus]|uniref:Uncharacterized protein n=1 Tax=Hyphococcus luteus TaxID=2058213 RepID=A0A2S7K9K7_9PROT|nr:hypothetical protein CW354_04495 [Marinicaulis flavus]
MAAILTGIVIIVTSIRSSMASPMSPATGPKTYKEWKREVGRPINSSPEDWKPRHPGDRM